MTLLKISEPGQRPEAHPLRRAVGIDLGTTHSLVATLIEGKATTLADAEGRVLLPSVIRYHEERPPEVGYPARDQQSRDPLNTLSSVKRLLGRSLEEMPRFANERHYAFESEAGTMPRIRTAAGLISPVQASAEILRVLAQRAECAMGAVLDGVVITVPAYFDDAQRQATSDAARLAGLKVLRLLNEPTAAAVAYGLDQAAEGIHAIYDLGGGTFDISILRFSQGVFEVMSTAGDSALGGDDMDVILAEWILTQAGLPPGIDPGQRRDIMMLARSAKEWLSTHDSMVLEVARPDGHRWSGQLDRAQFDGLIHDLVGRTLNPCQQALDDAGIVAADLADVIMVGGSTRTPLVRNEVRRFFGRDPHVDIDPDSVVALGAAIQADILVGNKPDSDMLLLDVIPLSLGLETMGGLTEKIVPRNTTIPVVRAQDFTTYKDGQTALSLHVLQGERELVRDNRSLARFELRGIPPMVAGAARIRVSYQVDADGLLSVSARELTQNIESRVEIKPSYGLSDGEIESMLTAAMDHAQEDINQRRLRELQIEADQALEAVASALACDGQRLLCPDERTRIDRAMAQLRAARSGSDEKAIQDASAALEQASDQFAQRRMNAAVNRVLTGHTINDFSGESDA